MSLRKVWIEVDDAGPRLDTKGLCNLETGVLLYPVHNEPGSPAYDPQCDGGEATIQSVGGREIWIRKSFADIKAGLEKSGQILAL